MYYKAKISYLKQAENGSIVKKSEVYLIDAVSHTEAEARLQMILESEIPEYDLVSLTKFKMTDAIFSDSDNWYKANISYVSYDEDSGKEKRINEAFMVNSSNINQVCSDIEERMEGSIVDWEITSVTLTNVLDVFPYEAVKELETEQENDEITEADFEEN